VTLDKLITINQGGKIGLVGYVKEDRQQPNNKRNRVQSVQIEGIETGKGCLEPKSTSENPRQRDDRKCGCSTNIRNHHYRTPPSLVNPRTYWKSEQWPTNCSRNGQERDLQSISRENISGYYRNREAAELTSELRNSIRYPEPSKVRVMPQRRSLRLDL